MIDTTLAAMDVIPLGTHDGLDLGRFEGSTDVITDRKLKGLLLGY